MKLLKYLLYILGSLLFLFALFLGYFTLKDYKPETRSAVPGQLSQQTYNLDTLHILNWNLGYAGLGEDMSFFYDGGDKVRTSLQQTRENLGAIQTFLKHQQGIDCFLLQEVDTASRRSYGIHQLKALDSVLPAYHSYFATNYHVDFVPKPFTKPLGKVRAGLATFSHRLPAQNTRYSFPGNYVWPLRLFMLDRCFLVTAFNLENGNQLLIINTHNSAYDNGALKSLQMEFLKEYLTTEYHKGNYIIVGGDWNQFPPGIKKYQDEYDLNKTTLIPSDYIPQDWTWAVDYNTPTNRSLEAPLNDKSRKAIIDFYLVSPNIKVLNVNTINLGFKHSDHQPVLGTFVLKGCHS